MLSDPRACGCAARCTGSDDAQCEHARQANTQTTAEARADGVRVRAGACMMLAGNCGDLQDTFLGVADSGVEDFVCNAFPDDVRVQ